MPLIIESYDFPYTVIATKLFPGKEFTYINKPCSEPSDSELFCYTRDIDDYNSIKYYFNRIYFVENGNRIVGVNKILQKIKIYDLQSGNLIKFQEEIKENKIDKSAFLPQMAAQNGDLVVFPDEEDEEI